MIKHRLTTQEQRNTIFQTLKDLNIQTWHTELRDSSKGRTYTLLKTDMELERYLLELPRNIYLPILKLRTANHKLPVENDNDVGDEFHYLLTCPFFENERKEHLKPYYYRRPNVLKLKALSSNKKTLIE